MTSLTTLLWAALVAQTPDSAAKLRIIDALQSMDASLTAVRGAAANFRVDLPAASPNLVRARAARIRARCVAARTAVANTQTVLSADVYTPNLRPKQDAVRAELIPLDRALALCESEWNTGSAVPADSLRAWGPFRATRLESALRRYEGRAGDFRSAAHIH